MDVYLKQQSKREKIGRGGEATVYPGKKPDRIIRVSENLNIIDTDFFRMLTNMLKKNYNLKIPEIYAIKKINNKYFIVMENIPEMEFQSEIECLEYMLRLDNNEYYNLFQTIFLLLKNGYLVHDFRGSNILLSKKGFYLIDFYSEISNTDFSSNFSNGVITNDVFDYLVKKLPYYNHKYIINKEGKDKEKIELLKNNLLEKLNLIFKIFKLE